MSQPPLTAAKSLQMMRIIFGVFIVHMGFVIFMAERLSKGDAKPIDSFYYTFAAVAVLELVIGIYLRGKLDPLYDARRLDPENTSLIGQRQVRHIVLFALSESIVLFGFVLRFLGTPLSYCIPFYAAGIMLLLLSAPRKLD